MSMESRRPRLSLDELRRLRWGLGGALMLLATVTVFYLDVDSEGVAAAALAGILLGLVRPDLPARVPLWAHRLAFPAIVLFFAGDLWLTAQVLPSMVRLDLLLMLYRGITYRQRRDDLQAVVLGLFLVVVAGVLTVSIAFAAQILVFTGCALALLLVTTLVQSAEGDAPPRPSGVPSWASGVGWGRLLKSVRAVTDWRLVALGSVLFAAVVAVSGLLFLAIPRFQLENSLFLERFITRHSRTGFSDTIRLGDVTEIDQDDGIALNVDLSDPALASPQPYWRMVVLDDYRDGVFRMSAEMRRAELPREWTDYALRGGRRPTPGSGTWTFYLEPGVSRYLPLVGHFETLRFREPQNFRVSTDLGIVALRDEPASMLAYRVEGMDARSEVLRDPGFAMRWKHSGIPAGIPLQIRLPLTPGDVSALSTIEKELAGPLRSASASPPDVAAFAERASQWLRNRHAYSLAPHIPGGEGDPIVRWMVSSEAGHCELFAGSLVLLARGAGLPARVVTGFKGGSWNAYSKNFMILNSDAHAWAEIWDDGRGGWLRADPLSAAAGPLGAASESETSQVRPINRSWSARWASLRVFWYRRIVDFDQRSQIDALRALKAATEDSGRRLRGGLGSWGAAVRSALAGPWRTRRIAAVLGAAAVIAAGTALLRRGAWRLAGVGGKDPVRRHAGRWLARVARDSPVVPDLQRLRYGRRETWPDPGAVFGRARRSAREGSGRASR